MGFSPKLKESFSDCYKAMPHSLRNSRKLSKSSGEFQDWGNLQTPWGDKLDGF
jgi:hypothetical protein